MEQFKEIVFGNYRYIEGIENVCYDEVLESLEFLIIMFLDCNIFNVFIKKYMFNGVIEVLSIKENLVNIYEMD